MYYLTMCVKESLRLHTVVPFVARQLSRPMEIEGVTLLPGTIIDICPWAVHHNPDVWGSDHMEYRPERFEIENFRKMDSHAFIPFSAGPRNCIGQSFAMHEVKTVVARILNSFRLEVDKSHPIEMSPELVLRSKHGIKLLMTPRQH
jgi:cytochrome P450